MEDVKFYKVVSKWEDRYFSAISHGHYTVEYIPGQFVKGKHPLFIYTDLISAVAFAAVHGSEVWEVEVKNPIRQEWVADNPFDYERFWNDYNKTKMLWWYRYTNRTPISVYVADEVKLVRKILP